ncbi:uncharacterized protein RSE6_01787 [Rhynchosporium secalis]|uniref:MYND-type domain-containing protein n=1 Tax=Rhynchosporium secalis TaxID=38038 RepID=A0A1E1LYL9_RHYSE|nr:uncharacterized protein RSE6_01787 [Rhynchosporium secalis]
MPFHRSRRSLLPIFEDANAMKVDTIPIATAKDWVWVSTPVETSEKSEPATCATCQKSQSDLQTSLKCCARCQTTRYCSVACQKEDWKAHKLVCGKPINPHNPGLTDDKDLPSSLEKDVFILLIDCYRLRMEDEYTFKGDAATGSLYGGALNPLPHFRKFLDKAEKKEGILPEWWDMQKRTMCEKEAVFGTWANINHAVEKSDIVQHYKNPMAPMTLRALGEKIYGEGFM